MGQLVQKNHLDLFRTPAGQCSRRHKDYRPYDADQNRAGDPIARCHRDAAPRSERFHELPAPILEFRVLYWAALPPQSLSTDEPGRHSQKRQWREGQPKARQPTRQSIDGPSDSRQNSAEAAVADDRSRLAADARTDTRCCRNRFVGRYARRWDIPKVSCSKVRRLGPRRGRVEHSQSDRAWSDRQGGQRRQCKKIAGVGRCATQHHVSGERHASKSRADPEEVQHRPTGCIPKLCDGQRVEHHGCSLSLTFPSSEASNRRSSSRSCSASWPSLSKCATR